jgi:hypothetical protein
MQWGILVSMREGETREQSKEEVDAFVKGLKKKHLAPLANAALVREAIRTGAKSKEEFDALGVPPLFRDDIEAFVLARTEKVAQDPEHVQSGIAEPAGDEDSDDAPASEEDLLLWEQTKKQLAELQKEMGTSKPVTKVDIIETKPVAVAELTEAEKIFENIAKEFLGAVRNDKEKDVFLTTISTMPRETAERFLTVAGLLKARVLFLRAKHISSGTNTEVSRLMSVPKIFLTPLFLALSEDWWTNPDIPVRFDTIYSALSKRMEELPKPPDTKDKDSKKDGEPKPDTDTKKDADKKPEPPATKDAHHASAEHHDNHGHGHGEPWHVPRSPREWGWLGAAMGVGLWEAAKFFFKNVGVPLAHSVGYIISGDAKHPWQTLFKRTGVIFDTVFKGFLKKGGGGHKSSGHDSGHGGGHH